MEHILLLLMIISFAVSFAALPVVFLCYHKTRRDYLKPYAFMFCFLSWNFVRLMILEYLGLAFDYSPRPASLAARIIASLEPFLVYFMAAFIHKLLSIKRVGLDFLFLGLSALFFAVNLSGVLFLVNSPPLRNLPQAVFLILLLYTIIISLARWKYVKDRVLMMAWLVLAAVYLLIYLGQFIGSFLLLSEYLPKSIPVPLPVFILYLAFIWFFVFNTLYLARIIRIAEKRLSDLPADFFNKFYISPREREVLKRLLEGKSNKQIATELYISLSTVKSHLYNSFKKLKVASRFELLRKLSTWDVV